jgi:prophage regulatory protein
MSDELAQADIDKIALAVAKALDAASQPRKDPAPTRGTTNGLGRPADRLLRIDEVIAITGMGKTSIYRLMRAGQFPQQFKPGGYASRWSEAEVTAWRDSQRGPQNASP